MRTKLAPQLLALALLGLSAGVLSAQEPGGSVAPAPGRTNPDVRQRQMASLMQRYEKVGLTHEQRTQLRPLVQSHLDELRAVRMDTSLSEEDRQARALSILETYREQIGSILTTEQTAKLAEMREANRKAALNAGTQKRKSRPLVEDEN